jgi:apolipoprotein D and lipocalin family protein
MAPHSSIFADLPQCTHSSLRSRRDNGITLIDYSLRDDGGLRVLNRGYSAKENTWKEAEGKAYFVKGSDQGYLKVSFFGPFYGSYIVFELDHVNYQYSLVCGPDKSYFWILARGPQNKKI